MNTYRSKDVSPFVEINYNEKLREILKDRNLTTLLNSFFPDGNQNRVTPRVFALREPPVTIIRVYVPEGYDFSSQNEREYKVYVHGRPEDVDKLREMIG